MAMELKRLARNCLRLKLEKTMSMSHGLTISSATYLIALKRLPLSQLEHLVNFGSLTLIHMCHSRNSFG